ncbi:ABC transporter substrate-binding protein [Aliifodinibius sp. S!AR15-10]|uniref:MlaC/ttg2D family ABC transporter substrate-binding protein n=1 Tax=Aliifodinibius sp. S!AR15-10 TaxID=2950437 RepID=UPI0028545044|nr:ABC transporter substrate-binding protein [Aliifodinibius sp. S!AR15-10]MDR8391132.1 ABC transporter substrate-binding protein [Aliifodinibius sp. S!AR15-10]
MKKIAILFIVLFIGSSVSVAAQKDSTAIRNLLEQRDDEIKDLLGPKGTEYTPEKRQKLKDIINGVIDYSAMAQHALQETYDTLTTEQRTEFIDYFSTIIRDQSLNKLDIYRADVSYNTIKVNGDSAFVNTTAVLENVRTPVSYDMYYKTDGKQWVITDMTIDDVSTADSYQRQFQNIIRKRGYAYLVNTLKKRAAK